MKNNYDQPDWMMQSKTSSQSAMKTKEILRTPSQVRLVQMS